MRWVVAYDVADDGARDRVAAKLTAYGVRVQYSVFECEIDPIDVPGLLEDLWELLDVATDDLAVWPLCGQCLDRRSRLGQATDVLDAAWYVVG